MIVGVREARTSQRRVKVAVDATTRGKLRLEVRRHGKVVASAAHHVEAGRRAIAVSGRFAPAYHDVRVTLRAGRGVGHRHEIRLFTSRTLPERLAVPTLDEPRCRRINRRRIDCEARYDMNPETQAAPAWPAATRPPSSYFPAASSSAARTRAAPAAAADPSRSTAAPSGPHPGTPCRHIDSAAQAASDQRGRGQPQPSLTRPKGAYLCADSPSRSEPAEAVPANRAIDSSAALRGRSSGAVQAKRRPPLPPLGCGAAL